jgi:hypothetical protein
MSAGAQAEKICVVCGTDVASKPRVKNAQGEYLCKVGDCEKTAIARAKAAASTPRSAPPILSDPDQTLMSNLIASSPMLSAKSCPTCSAPVTGNAVVCVRCGCNLQTGKQIKTAVIHEKVKKEPGAAAKAASGTVSMLTSPWVVALVLFLILGSVGVVGATVEGMALPALIIMGVMYIVALIWAISEAFRDGAEYMPWFMLSHLLGGLIPIGYVRVSAVIGFFCTIYYCIFETDKGYLRVIYLGTAAALIAFIGIILSQDPDKLTNLLNP